MYVRKATIEDIDTIHGVQVLNYATELIESRDTFIEIISQGNSFVACDDSEIIGFLLCHAWNFVDLPPLLHGEWACSSKQARCMYLHDLSVHPKHRNQGIGLALVQQSILSTSLPKVLVSVNNSSGFWEKLGFRKRACPTHILQSYGCPSAVFMSTQ